MKGETLEERCYREAVEAKTFEFCRRAVGEMKWENEF